MFSKQVTSKDQEMGEMEFKAHGPIYGDERIRAGGREGNFINLMHIFYRRGSVSLHQRVFNLLSDSGKLSRSLILTSTFCWPV